MTCEKLTRWVCVLLVAGLCSCDKAVETGGEAGVKPAADANAAKEPDGEQWIALFDGESLKGWKVPKFGGDGKVHVKDGVLHIEMGDMCTGITYVEDDANAPVKKLPREDYEIEVETMRAEGDDFFCGLTFPVGKDYISLIPDGWAGAVTGLSCLDDFDASLNETTQDVEFKNNKWYRLRARVTKTHITCWVDDKQIINVARKGRKINVRGEVEDCCPLGIATWQTHGAIRGIWLRKL